jgi:hypothetical protein
MISPKMFEFLVSIIDSGTDYFVLILGRMESGGVERLIFNFILKVFTLIIKSSKNCQ